MRPGICNIMKLGMKYEDFINHINRIAEYKNKRLEKGCKNDK